MRGKNLTGSVFSRLGAAALLLVLAASSAYAGDRGSLAGRDYATFSLFGVLPEDATMGPGDPFTKLSQDNEAELVSKFGFGLAAAAGYKLDNGVRLEMEYAYRGFDLDKVQLKGISGSIHGGEGEVGGNIHSLLWSGAYDFKIPYSLTATVGAGVGIAFNNFSLPTVAGVTEDGIGVEDLTMAFQVMTGIAYPWDDHWEAVLGYRFFGTDSADFEGLATGFNIHNFELGVRYYFDRRKRKSKEYLSRKKIYERLKARKRSRKTQPSKAE